KVYKRRSKRGSGAWRDRRQDLSRLFPGVLLGIRVLARSNPPEPPRGRRAASARASGIAQQAKKESAMIDLHYWTTPNGHKITMFLEETGVPYNIVPVNLVQNDQFKPEFLEIAPNNKIPAIVDRDPVGGGAPISIFESGAILHYLAEKTGKLMPQDIRARVE